MHIALFTQNGNGMHASRALHIVQSCLTHVWSFMVMFEQAFSPMHSIQTTWILIRLTQWNLILLSFSLAMIGLISLLPITAAVKWEKINIFYPLKMRWPHSFTSCKDFCSHIQENYDYEPESCKSGLFRVSFWYAGVITENRSSSSSLRS